MFAIKYLTVFQFYPLRSFNEIWDRKSAAENQTCQKLVSRAAPQNGKLDCQRHRQTPTIACQVSCNKGFEFVERPAKAFK